MEIGGWWREGFGCGVGCERGGGDEVEERETVFWDFVGGELLFAEVQGNGDFSGRPEIMGGGSSRPSTAFRESWRAKSDACHHSRNLSANMEVGRRIRKLESKRG